MFRRSLIKKHLIKEPFTKQIWVICEKRIHSQPVKTTVVVGLDAQFTNIRETQTWLSNKYCVPEVAVIQSQALQIYFESWDRERIHLLLFKTSLSKNVYLL